ncbi:flagellar hook-basal body complex protein [uncultured Jannaschia sp.]|uniref:flagellar hook protein FlgE n=1 Tax=uncultured Jannaschia sp. TaxID=293347 RepID=UPI002624B5EA|nr:flagellar hook-basal body complex protein [uncultured Jannaschia sp.]
MTISSSLNAGVSGLNVNASRLATISDNIANSSTYGYKRATSDFHSLVSGDNRGTYSAGGVRATTGRDVSQNGSLVTTNNATDLAVTGRGMLAVTPISAVENGRADLPFQMTTTGSFRPDKNGVLRTDSGLALLGWPAAKDGSIPNVMRDTPSSLVPVRVELTEFEGDPTTKMSLGVNLPASATADGESGDSYPLQMEYFGNLGESQALDIKFTPVLPAPGDLPTNEWTMTIVDKFDPAATPSTFTLTFADGSGTGGTLADVKSTPAGLYDDTTGLISLNVISGPIEIEIGKYNDTKGLSQLGDTYAPVAVSKNGSPVGKLTSVEVDPNGRVVGLYDSGLSRTLYKLPVVDVTNPDGLKALPNQTYTLSSESGPLYLWDAGTGPVGEIMGYSREESTTDVAGELTNLIKTQRSYSSNAKVIQTVDEMLQETTNIKR